MTVWRLEAPTPGDGGRRTARRGRQLRSLPSVPTDHGARRQPTPELIASHARAAPRRRPPRRPPATTPPCMPGLSRHRAILGSSGWRPDGVERAGVATTLVTRDNSRGGHRHVASPSPARGSATTTRSTSTTLDEPADVLSSRSRRRNSPTRSSASRQPQRHRSFRCSTASTTSRPLRERFSVVAGTVRVQAHRERRRASGTPPPRFYRIITLARPGVPVLEHAPSQADIDVATGAWKPTSSGPSSPASPRSPCRPPPPAAAWRRGHRRGRCPRGRRGRHRRGASIDADIVVAELRDLPEHRVSSLRISSGADHELGPSTACRHRAAPRALNLLYR